MRLIEMEYKIKEMIANGEEGDELYSLIFYLSKCYLMRHKLLHTEKDSEEVAELMATDLYLERHRIKSWIGYIRSSRMRFITKWRNGYKIQIIEPKGRTELMENVVQMSCGSTIEYEHDRKQVPVPDFIQSIPFIINKALELSRFYPDTPEFLNARVSITLSIIHDRFISVGLNEQDSNYTRMIYRVVLDEISSELYSEEDANTTDVMKIFALEDFKGQAEEIGRTGISL